MAWLPWWEDLGVVVCCICSQLLGWPAHCPLVPPPPPLPFQPLYTLLSCFTASYNPNGCPNNPTDLSLNFQNNDFCICFWLFTLLSRRYSVVWLFSRAASFSRQRTFFHTKEHRRLFSQPNLLHLFRNDFLFCLQRLIGSFWEHPVSIVY